jgi:hypothetical protein
VPQRERKHEEKADIGATIVNYSAFRMLRQGKTEKNASKNKQEYYTMTREEDGGTHCH